MSKETMNLGEAFSAKVVGGSPTPEVKTRHYVIGWGFVVSVIGGFLYWIFG